MEVWSWPSLPISREKREMTNIPKRKRKRSKSVLWKKPLHQQKCQNYNNATKMFDFTAVAERLRTVSRSNYGHPTGVVNRFTCQTILDRENDTMTLQIRSITQLLRIDLGRSAGATIVFPPVFLRFKGPASNLPQSPCNQKDKHLNNYLILPIDSSKSR